MSTTLPRLPVRTSEALRELIAAAGPVNAATRALIILGAQAAGLDLGPEITREIYALLLCERLDPGVRAALEAVLGAPGPAPRAGGATGAVTGAVTSDSTAPEEEDPFASVGIEV